MDNGGTGLVVLLLRDPHLLEGGEGGEDGAADPDRVLPLGRSDDLDLHGARRQGGDLLLHPVKNLNLSHRSNDIGLLTNLFGFEEYCGFRGIKTKMYCQISKITNNNEKMWFQIN